MKRFLTGPGGSSKKAKDEAPEPTFVIAPGAGGKLPQDGALEVWSPALVFADAVRALLVCTGLSLSRPLTRCTPPLLQQGQLAILGRVILVKSGEDCKYAGMRGVTASKKALSPNLHCLHAAIAKAAKREGPIFLVGQSFGCRLVVHWLAKNSEV